MKRKAFVVLVNSAPLNELNELLDKGWSVVEVHPSNGGQSPQWLVIAEEPAPSEAGGVRPARP